MILVTKGSHHLLLPEKMKEETGKSIKNALYVLCRYAKKHLLGGSNVEQ